MNTRWPRPRKRKTKFKVGDQAIASFKCWNGSIYRERGTIKKIWGKVPYAVTFIENNGGQPIRIGIHELRPVRSREKGK